MFFWICTPALYYANVWYTAYLPLCTATVYDNTAQAYNVSKVLNADNTFNVTAYEAYSPAFLPATFAFVYGISFASLTAVPVHIYLWHGEQILDALKGRTKLDIHARLMRLYPRTPWYWYGAVTVVMFVISIVMVEKYSILLPWWGAVLALVIPAIYMIPCGIIQGITNVDANQLNVLSEFIGGYMFNGRPLASKWNRNRATRYSGLTKLNRHGFQDPVNRRRWPRVILCTRHETRSLPQDSATHFISRTRLGNRSRRSDSSWSHTMDAGQHL